MKGEKTPDREVIESGSGKSVLLQVSVEASSDTPTYYVNHAALTFSEHEIAMVFARMPTKPSREDLAEAEEFGELSVEPELQLLIPPTVVPRLIDALQTIKEHYEATYWKIGKVDAATS